MNQTHNLIVITFAHNESWTDGIIEVYTEVNVIILSGSKDTQNLESCVYLIQ